MKASRTTTVTRRGRVSEPTRAAAVMAARVGSALLVCLAVVVGIPTASWGVTATSSVAGWSLAYATSGGSSTVQLTGVTLDNSDRGIGSISWSRSAEPNGYGTQVNAYCATDANANVPWTSSSSPSGFTSFTGDAYWTTSATSLTVSDATPAAARSNFLTELCPSGQTVRAIRVYAWDLGTNAAGYSVFTRSLPATPSTCSTFSGLKAAYAGGVLSVRFGWAGTLPASNWRVHAPGDGYTTTGTSNTTTIPRVKLTGTSTYGKDLTATLSLTVGSSTVRVSSGDSWGCYAVVTVTGSLEDTPASQGTDPTTGEACSSWDLFCQIRSAFTPSASSLDQWDGLKDQASDVVPFGYVLDAVEGFSYITSCSGAGCDDTKLSGLCFDPGIGGPDVAGPLGSGVCPFGENAVTDWLTSQRPFLSFLAWAGVLGPLVGMVWRRSLPFMSSGD